MQDLYESVLIKPLLQGSIIESAGRKFKSHRWFRGDKHYYEFENIESNNPIENFERKPTEVSDAIRDGRIKIIKIINF